MNKEKIKMGKPISIIIREAKETILEAINKCNLHPSILEFIIKDIYMNVAETAKNISEIEEKQYLQNKNTTTKTENKK